MDNKITDVHREFRRLYEKADYKTRRKIDLEMHRVVTRNKSKKQLESSLFEAGEWGNLNAVRRMIKTVSNLDINCTVKLDNTTLIKAILKKDSRIVELLISNNAEPYIQKNKGKNSFDAADLIKNSDIIKFLKRHG